jgi:hypothetical protein
MRAASPADANEGLMFVRIQRMNTGIPGEGTGSPKSLRPHRAFKRGATTAIGAIKISATQSHVT